MKKYTEFVLGMNVQNLDGTDAKIANETQDALISFNVRTAFRRALNGVFQDEQQSLKFEDRVARYELSKKIWAANKEVELSTEEQAILKNCIKKMFVSPEICGFMNDVLEGKVAETKKAGK